VRFLTARRDLPHADAGYATVWVVTAMAVVTVAAAAAIGDGVAVVARHRAGAAADAAALAVALRAIDGSSAACASGAALARADGGRLTSCDLSGAFVQVVVAVRLPGPLARFGPATGQARAGPASASTAVSSSVEVATNTSARCGLAAGLMANMTCHAP
jgi:secretion/DNA translocation related TadE-like protein